MKLNHSNLFDRCDFRNLVCSIWFSLTLHTNSIFSEGYYRYLALCLTLSVSQSVRVFQWWVKVDPSSRYLIISLLKTNTHLSSITTAIFGFNKSSILEETKEKRQESSHTSEKKCFWKTFYARFLLANDWKLTGIRLQLFLSENISVRYLAQHTWGCNINSLSVPE